MFCKLDALGVNCRDRAVALQSHAKHFRQAVHAVRRVHARAGTAGRACLAFIFVDILLAHRAGCQGADRLKHA